MCHGYKLASLNWCCQLLPCSDGEKSGLLAGASFRGLLTPQGFMISVFSLQIVFLIKRETTKTSTALPLQEQ